MITVDEIRKKAKRLYPQFLKSALVGETFFPLSLRSDKSLSNDFVEMSKEISILISGSKDRKGYGYQVLSRQIKTRSHGIQDIPESIIFENNIDYLQFIGKEKEFGLFIDDVQLIKDKIPRLLPFIQLNPLLVVNNCGKWWDILRVCDWFLNNFEPDKYYIRELPIAVHTKFIEENKSVLCQLLDMLIPDKIDSNELEFEKRFRLKYAQPLVRFRFLDSAMVDGYKDLCIPLEDFATKSIECRGVFIVENKMNFLTFPMVTNSIALWGKGFAIESLKHVSWLSDKEIYYWSDLDVQGFQMLSQLRTYFPQTRSFLMEAFLIESLKHFIVEGTPCNIPSLANLSENENALFTLLRDKNLRLEQERIPQWEVGEEIKKYFKM